MSIAATETNPVLAAKSTKDPTITGQRGRAKRALKAMPSQMLRDIASKSLQTQRKQTSIELAREKRTGQKRTQMELLEETFARLEMNDGKPLSVSQIGKELGAAWSTIYWLTRMIEFVQSKPRLIRDNMKRKRFYSLGGPRPRHR